MKKISRFTKVTIFACTAALAIPATWAQTPNSARPPSFEEADADHDDVIDIEEARLAFRNLIIEDIDSDGVLNRREAEQALPSLEYTRDSHEDVEAPIGVSDYLKMVEYYLRPQSPRP